MERPGPKKNTKPLVRDLNAHLVCVLCGGYYIDATTIVECLHSFCRSCIVRHLEGSKFCPICDVQAYKAKAMDCIRPDSTLQTLVYKLVPGLYQLEMQRRREFHSGPQPSCSSGTRKPTAEERGEGLPVFFSPEDSVCLSLQYYSENDDEEEPGASNENDNLELKEEESQKRYLKCPAAVNVGQLQRFILLKYGLTSEHRVDIIYAGECLPEDFTLMDVAYTFSWKRTSPMEFSYRIFHLPVLVFCESPVATSPANLQAHSPAAAAEEPADTSTFAQPTAAETENGPATTSPSPSPAPAAEEPSSPNGARSGETSSSVSNTLNPQQEPTPVQESGEEVPAADCEAKESKCDEVKKEEKPCNEEEDKAPVPAETDSKEEKEKELTVSPHVSNSESGDVSTAKSENPNAKEGDAKETETKSDEPTEEASLEDASTNDSSGLEIRDSAPQETSVESASKEENATETKIESVESSMQEEADDFINDEDEDDFPLRISSTEEEDEEEAEDNTKTETPKVSEKVEEAKKEEKCEEVVKPKRIKLDAGKEKDKQKQNSSGKKRSKHKSKHHHQRGEEGTKKRKTHRSNEMPTTPTILQFDEDSIKLKVKLSGTPSHLVGTTVNSNQSSNHRHHHHHSKHHHKHKQNDASSDISSSGSRSNDDSTTSAKERLLQMRAVRHKNINPNKKSDQSQACDEGLVSKSKKSGPMIMPPSSITVSKVNSAEKRKLDIQKLGNSSCSDAKRPSLEIMLVNAPSSTQSNSNSTKMMSKTGTSVSLKQAPSSSSDTDMFKKSSSQTDNKPNRPPPATIPLLRFKKPSSSTIRPPSGLTITPKIPTMISNKSSSAKVASSKASDSNGHQPKKDSGQSEADGDSEEQPIKHDNIGALDLSGKSSRCKDGGPSTSPDACSQSSGSSGSSPSPAKGTATSTHQSILSIAQSLVHRQLTNLNLQQGLNIASSTSPLVSPTSISSSVSGNRNGTNSPSSPENALSSVLLGSLSASSGIPGTSGVGSSGIAPGAMSNLKTLSDAAVHIRNLMAAQGKSNNRCLGKQQQMGNIQNAQQQSQKSPSGQVNNPPSLGLSGRASTGPFSANTRTQSNAPPFSPLHHHLHHQSPAVTRSPNHSQQYSLPGSPVPPSPASPIRIPIPPSPLKNSPAGRGTNSGNSPRSNVPRLHELYPGGSSGSSAGRGKGLAGVSYLSRNNLNNVAKPGPNQAVRHIPNPSALLFRQQAQHRLQAQLTQNSLNRTTLATMPNINTNTTTANKTPTLFHQNQNQTFNNNNNTNATTNNNNNNSKSTTQSVGATSVSSSTSSQSATSHQTPVSSIRKMENMTRNIEKVAAGLTVRAVEANVSGK